MVEWMLEDASRAHDFRYVALRYFNVAGTDPAGRLGQSTPKATHLIKRGVQTALGIYPSLEIFGQDYPTRDGTCVRDYIQVTDLIDAHLAALAYLRDGGASLVCNCGYGHGQTVKEVIDVVKRVSGVDFKVVLAPRRAETRPPSSRGLKLQKARSAGSLLATISTTSFVRRSTGNGASTTAALTSSLDGGRFRADDPQYLHRPAFWALHRCAIRLIWRQTLRGESYAPGRPAR